MKPWRIVKIVLSALWLAVTLTGLIYWTVKLAYPWNTTNLWLVPLYLAFPLWAFLGAVLNKERPLLYLIIKTFVIVLASVMTTVNSWLSPDSSAVTLKLPSVCAWPSYTQLLLAAVIVTSFALIVRVPTFAVIDS